MKLNIYGELHGLIEGLKLICKDLDVSLDESGVPVSVEKSTGEIEVTLKDGRGCIKYNDRIHFFRAFGLFVEALRQRNNFHIVEVPRFDTNGVMLDVSRNAVLKTESIKDILKKLAVMGLNMVMLYTEDTYEVKGLPYFGYMRGRYTCEELKECDDFADMFGIEMIPCIQTLGHLTQALKWSAFEEIRDTADILLAGSEKTYTFIEEIMRAASAPFRSKRIHIGMDEAFSLGLGRYLSLNGFQRRFDIMNTHLTRVNEIACSMGLKPMIWSDMYFRLGSRTGIYRDKNTYIPPEVVEMIPKNVQLVYWDYGNEEEDTYNIMFKMHKELGCEVLFAGGVWTWTGLSVNYKKTFQAADVALGACKKEGVREVFATMWGDNGGETNAFTGLLGMQLFAEHGYSSELDMEKLKKRFSFCTGGNYDAFMSLSDMDAITGAIKTKDQTDNPSKFLLWQDIMLGLFDKHVERLDTQKHYSELAAKLENYRREAGDLAFIFEMPARLAEVLSLKSKMGIYIKECYDSSKLKELKEIAEKELPELLEKVRLLRETHRDQWFKTNKPFGWEIIDIRYGGVIVRIETAIHRLSQYLTGEIDRIEELEEERLYFDGPDRETAEGVGRFPHYSRMASASPL